MRCFYCLFICLLRVGCDSQKLAIKLGVVLHLSSEFQIYGLEGLNGTRLTVDEINKAGGVLGGHKLELIDHDNRASLSEAVHLGRELIQIDNVSTLPGSVSSAARNAMAGQQLYSGADQIILRDDHHFDLPMYLAESHQGELNIIKNLGLIIPRDQRQAALTP